MQCMEIVCVIMQSLVQHCSRSLRVNISYITKGPMIYHLVINEKKGTQLLSSKRSAKPEKLTF